MVGVLSLNKERATMTTKKRAWWNPRTDTMWGAIIIVVICMWIALYDFSFVRKQSKEMQKEFAQIQQQHAEMINKVNAFSDQMDHVHKALKSFQSSFDESIEKNRKAIESIQANQDHNDHNEVQSGHVHNEDHDANEAPLHLRDSSDLAREIRNELDQRPAGTSPSPEMIARFKVLRERRIDEFHNSMSEEQWVELQERTDEVLDSSFENSLSRMPEEMRDELRPMMEAGKERVRGQIEKSVMMQMMNEVELKKAFDEVKQLDELEALHE